MAGCSVAATTRGSSATWRGALLAALALAACGPVEAPEVADAACPHEPPTCRRNTLLTCDDAGAPVEIPCGEERCAADAPRPRCVPATALPCTPDERPPRCRNGLLETCDPASGYPTTADCGPGELCVERDGEGTCVDVEGVPCDPDGATPLCVGGRRIECEPARRRLREAGHC